MALFACLCFLFILNNPYCCLFRFSSWPCSDILLFIFDIFQNGKSALEHASHNGHHDVARLIEVRVEKHAFRV